MGIQEILVGAIVFATALYAGWHIVQVLIGKKNDCNCPGCDKVDKPSSCGCQIGVTGDRDRENGHG